MWFRNRKARDTHTDLAQAEESLDRARGERAEQQRKRQQEHDRVIRRLGRAQESNNIAAIIRQALQHHGEHT